MRASRNRISASRLVTSVNRCGHHPAWCFGMLMAGLLTVSLSSAVAGDWPSFRGPNVDGRSSETGSIPSGDVSLSLGWKVSIGSGYSGIAVAEDHVLTMFSTGEGEKDVIAAYRVDDGREAWRVELGPTYTGHDGSHTGPIATPLVHDGMAYALGAFGELKAIEMKSGKVAWEIDLTKEHGATKPHYGFSTSPIVVDGTLIVEGGVGGSAVAGFDPKTGELRWKLGEDRVSYQTPMPYTMGGRDIVLAPGDTKMFGIDAKKGELLWDFPHGGGGARGAGSMTPVPTGNDHFFMALRDEDSAMMKLASSGGGMAPDTIWEKRTIRNSYNVPIYHDDHVYAYSSRFLTCVDTESGKAAWRSRQPGDGFLIYADGHLVIATKKGGVHLAKASPEGYEERASLPVFADLIWSHPAYSNGQIFVRSLGELARIDLSTSGQMADRGEAQSPKIAGGVFDNFLSKVSSASDKQAVVDEFLGSIEEFPLIEAPNVVHFLYQGEAEDVAVAGDMFGARQERPMQRIPETNLYFYSMRLEEDARMNYVFMKDYEELRDPRNSRKTSTTMVTNDMELSFGRGDELQMSWFSMPKWRHPSFLSPRTTVETLASPAMGGAQVKFELYLPEGYASSRDRYPVIYIHGGKDASERGEFPRAMDALMKDQVKPAIAVFIHTAPRGPQYTNMMIQDLVPHMDKMYRTIAEADARVNYGAGFAALPAITTTFAHTEIFGKVACQSPFIFDSMMPMVTQSVSSNVSNPPMVYMDWGKYDLRNPHEAWDLSDSARKLAAFMKDNGVSFVGGQVNDGTGWSSWKMRTDRWLTYFFPQS
ncbi:MAG: PQQ-binding-like beta-propeller repeat protein [Phycisphaerae bacterium]